MPSADTSRRVNLHAQFGVSWDWAAWVRQNSAEQGTTCVLTFDVGYPMAKNLRTKLPADDIVIVHDINEAATASLAKEFQEDVRVLVANSVREVAERSVSLQRLSPFPVK